jgi:hypothetical protein
VQARPVCDLLGFAEERPVSEAGTKGALRRRDTGMRRSSRRVLLICEECGEKLLLGEPEEVWLSTRTRLECKCGEDVSLASRLEDHVQHYEGQ